MQRKLYYVYGQGWGARDGLRLKPTETIGQGKDYAWSSTRQPNALYYRLDFDAEGEGTVKCILYWPVTLKFSMSYHNVFSATSLFILAYSDQFFSSNSYSLTSFNILSLCD